MKILITGSDKIYAIENYYVKYLREYGINVFHFPSQNLFLDHYSKNIFNKIIFKAGLSPVYELINNKFKEEVEKFQPDVIWVFKGMEIYPESLQWAKNRNIKLVNYNPDNPFLFSGKGSGNKNITLSLALYNLHLTYNSSVMQQIENKYQLPAALLPFGFEVGAALYNECYGIEEIIKPCFLGNPDIFRAEFIKQLAGLGIKIDVYGHNWPKFIHHPNVSVFNPVYDKVFWKTLRKYRVQLNLMRPHNPESHNMRSFEVPGIGGIQLAPKTEDHESYFKCGNEIFLFSDIEECYYQLKKLLGLPEYEANKIRLNARSRSLNSGYSYAERTGQALIEINNLLVSR